MKNMLAVAVLCVLSLAAGQSATKVENEIKNLEQDWAQADVKNGATAVDQYEADDIIKTDPSGGVTDKAREKADVGSGDLKFECMELSNVTVHVDGDPAVVAATKNRTELPKGR